MKKVGEESDQRDNIWRIGESENQRTRRVRNVKITQYMKKGKLIVIEGSDGSGKATQTALLREYCEKNKIPTKSISFPQYTTTFFGKTIARVLRGEIAPLNQINPYLISLVYAMDRAEAREKMYNWLNNGKTIILDRYVSSNMAHQTGRLPAREQSKFLRWLDELEYKVNNVPREDVVVFLYVPISVTLKLMENKNRQERTHMKGKKKDMVEENIDYLKRAEKTYLLLAKKYPHWVQIDCTKNGEMRTREEIHDEIVSVLKQKGLI